MEETEGNEPVNWLELTSVDDEACQLCSEFPHTVGCERDLETTTGKTCSKTMSGWYLKFPYLVDLEPPIVFASEATLESLALGANSPTICAEVEKEEASLD